jgi:hypothetical protein
VCGSFDTNILELHSSHAGSKINRSVKLPSNKKNGYKFKYSTVCNKQERVSFVCFSYFVASSFTTTRRFFVTRYFFLFNPISHGFFSPWQLTASGIIQPSSSGHIRPGQWQEPTPLPQSYKGHSFAFEPPVLAILFTTAPFSRINA